MVVSVPLDTLALFHRRSLAVEGTYRFADWRSLR
jgi:hypothetical protein